MFTHYCRWELKPVWDSQCGPLHHATDTHEASVRRLDVGQKGLSHSRVDSVRADYQRGSGLGAVFECELHAVGVTGQNLTEPAFVPDGNAATLDFGSENMEQLSTHNSNSRVPIHLFRAKVVSVYLFIVDIGEGQHFKLERSLLEALVDADMVKDSKGVGRQHHTTALVVFVVSAFVNCCGNSYLMQCQSERASLFDLLVYRDGQRVEETYCQTPANNGN